MSTYFKTLILFKTPAKVSTLLKKYVETIFGPDVHIQDLEISELQSYEDAKSFNYTFLYNFNLIQKYNKQTKQSLIIAVSWPASNEYGYNMGKMISGAMKDSILKIPKYYIYDREHNAVIEEYFSGHKLTRSIVETGTISNNQLRSIVKWLVDLQRVKPTMRINKSINSKDLENNLRILKERHTPEIEKMEKEYENILREISSTDKIRNKFLVHGDFNPANILTDGTVLAVIDFENVYMGDGVADIANFLSYSEKLLIDRSGAVAEKYDDMALLLFKEYGCEFTEDDKRYLKLYKRYFDLLFKTHPLVWH